MDIRIPPTDVVGPYSAWPRQQMSVRAKTAIAGCVGTAAVFAHCVAPMI